MNLGVKKILTINSIYMWRIRNYNINNQKTIRIRKFNLIYEFFLQSNTNQAFHKNNIYTKSK